MSIGHHCDHAAVGSCQKIRKTIQFFLNVISDGFCTLLYMKNLSLYPSLVNQIPLHGEKQQNQSSFVLRDIASKTGGFHE